MMNMFKTKSKGRQHALLDEVFQRWKLLKKKKRKRKRSRWNVRKEKHCKKWRILLMASQ